MRAGDFVTGSFTATGASRTREATESGAASTPSSRCCSRPGCYADFTFPSAPDETQPAMVNQIYWPTGDPRQARAHESGARARVGEVRKDRILMIQGPLALARRERRLGVRIENAALTARDPGTRHRVDTWVSQAIHVAGRPEWIYVKVHTHGAPEAEARSLLGEPGRAMHRALRRYNDGRRFILHYVSAREMFNHRSREHGRPSGNPHEFRDYVLPPRRWPDDRPLWSRVPEDALPRLGERLPKATHAFASRAPRANPVVLDGRASRLARRGAEEAFDPRVRSHPTLSSDVRERSRPERHSGRGRSRRSCRFSRERKRRRPSRRESRPRSHFPRFER